MSPRLRSGFVAVAVGLVLAASLPPVGLWPLAPLGIAGLDWLLDGQPAPRRFERTFIALFALFLPTMFWMQYLTLPGWLIASAFFPLLFAIGAAALPPTRTARWIALPGMWLIVDALRSRWPFGGVPLSTLALGQVDGPLAGVARVGGALLLTGVTVVAGVALAAVARRQWKAAAAATAGVAIAVVLAAVAPHGHRSGTLNVALVQGGGPTGHRDVEADDQRVFSAHLAASEMVSTPVDLVVWPEDVVDTAGPLADDKAGDQLRDLARRLGAPLIVGSIEDASPDRFTNSAVVFLPDGSIGDRYEKVRRVPFGEYTPLRFILDKIQGDALIQSEALPGHDPATLDTPAGRFGVAISWEIFFSDRARNAIGNGGTVLLNPTNGATFRGTQVQTQQLASSRLRAIETGRWVLQVAPTGFSAVVTPSGRVVARTGIGDQVVVQRDVDTRTGKTWAVQLGEWPIVILGALLVASGWGLHGRRRGSAGPGGSGGSENVASTYAGATT